MIEFVSLLLGLVVGTHPVELSAVGSIAAVEMRLDGRTVVERPVSPGSSVRLEIDFGRELRPHELVAIARDAAGRELDRSRRWINLDERESGAASLTFAGGEGGLPREVGVVWESFGQRQPQAVEVSFDGQPLAVDDPARVPLPAYDPETMHFVAATVRFSDDRVSRLEAAFGGGRGAEIETELTAVAVTVAKGVRLPEPSAMGSWFSKQGQSLTVHGIEKGEPEVVVVRDPSARAALGELTSLISSRSAARQPFAPSIVTPDHVAARARARLVSPVAVPLPTDRVSSGLFLHGPELDAGKNGFLWLAGENPPQSFRPALASAVALAGLHAHASQRPRAVVLLLGAGDGGGDRFSPAEARRFLGHLQVPLFVLRTGEGQPDPEWGAAAGGPARSAVVELSADAKNTFAHVERAFRPLRASLLSQRIVWLEGHHLPQSIELAPEIEGVRLVGSAS